MAIHKIINDDNLAKHLIDSVLRQVGSNIKDYELSGCDGKQTVAIFLGVFFPFVLTAFYLLARLFSSTAISRLKMERDSIMVELREGRVEIPAKMPWHRQASKAIGDCVSAFSRRSKLTGNNNQDEELGLVARDALGNLNASRPVSQRSSVTTGL